MMDFRAFTTLGDTDTSKSINSGILSNKIDWNDDILLKKIPFQIREPEQEELKVPIVPKLQCFQCNQPPILKTKCGCYVCRECWQNIVLDQRGEGISCEHDFFGEKMEVGLWFESCIGLVEKGGLSTDIVSFEDYVFNEGVQRFEDRDIELEKISKLQKNLQKFLKFSISEQNMQISTIISNLQSPHFINSLKTSLSESEFEQIFSSEIKINQKLQKIKKNLKFLINKNSSNPTKNLSKIITAHYNINKDPKST